jgi:hypothetical protein
LTRKQISVSAADQTPKTVWDSRDPRDAGSNDVYRMRPHHVVGRPAVLGDSGLPIGGRRDEHHVAGFGERSPSEEPGHGVASGEPDRQRRHLKPDIGLQQLGERRKIGVFKGRAVAVE